MEHRVRRAFSLGDQPYAPAFAWRLLLFACALYTLGFLCFYPNAVTNDDEAQYLRQVHMVLDGKVTYPLFHPLQDEQIEHNPSLYPIGTAILMAPLAAVFGTAGAYLLPLLGLLAAALILGRWLEEAGYSPAWALILFGYPPTLVMGRVAMSDVPAAALVVVGLYCFWRGIDGSWKWSFSSGFLAGGGLILRESNPIPFVPFYLGAVLRRDRNVPALVVGGLLGSSLRYIANYAIHGQIFYQKARFHLALDLVPEKLPLYFIATMIFVPGGLLFALLYRGKRWPELRAAVVLFVGLYLVQKYWTFATSDLKRLIITPRYLISIVPLFAFGMAESVPRLWRRFTEGAGPERSARERAAGMLLTFWVAGVLIATAAVHPAFHWWSGGQGHIQAAINANIEPDVPMVTNYAATRKFIEHTRLRYLPIERFEIEVAEGRTMLERYGTLQLVFLDRSDSEFWLRDAEANARFLADLSDDPQLVFEQTFSSVERLHIWKVSHPPDRHPSGP